MANMDTTGFLIELRRLKGVEIGEPTVRYHARAGRIGRKVDGLWVFNEADIEAIMEYSGKREPEAKLGIRKMVWDEITEKWGDGSVLMRYPCYPFVGIDAMVRYLIMQERWEWEIKDGGETVILTGVCDTPEEAKAACEAAWHELLMRDVLEVL